MNTVPPFTSTATTMPTTLKILSSMASRQMLTELIALYPQRNEVRMNLEAAGGMAVAQRVRAGEALDIVVLAADVIDQLSAEGHVQPGSRVDLVRSGVAVAVRAGTARPDITTGAALRQAVLDAPTLGYSTGPSGTYLMQLFERWGIAAQIQDCIVQAPPGVPVGQLVAEGRVALGFQQLSELVHLPGIDVVGPLPPEVQHVTVFAAGLSTACTQVDAARDVLAFMTSDAAVTTKRLNGLDPA